MNNLYEQYENHPLFQTLANKIDFINNALKDDSYNEQQKESLLAYQQLLIIIQTNLSSRALPMVSQSVLDNLNTSISNLSTGILLNINGYPSQYHNVMDWYKRIPTIEKKSEIKESFNSLIQGFLIKQDKIEKKVNLEVTNFQTRQEEQFANWDAQKKDMQEEIDSLRIQNNNLKTQVENFEKEIQDQQKKLNNLIEIFQTTFDENSADFEERFNSKENEYNSKIDALLAEQKNTADNILSHLEQRRDEIEKLWGIIGQAAISGNSQNYANKAKLTADVMMYVTLGIMLIVVFVLSVTTVIDLIQGKFNYLHFMYKILGSTIFLVPAFYCSNISKRHRDREFQLRDFEVKTAALEPFMENMILENTSCDEKEINKDKVKLELTKVFFDKQFSNTNTSNDCILIPKEIAKILNTFAKKCNLNINLGDVNEQNSK